jgi:hypothetical protein
MSMSFRATFLIAVIAATGLLQGCAETPLDPFKRPYFGKDAYPANAPLCGDPSVDVQPKLIRGNHPAMPIANSFDARNAAATVRFRVAPSGAIEIVKVDSSDMWYGRHASAAVRDWKVTPAQRDGVAVAAACEVQLGAYFRGYQDDAPGKANR